MPTRPDLSRRRFIQTAGTSTALLAAPRWLNADDAARKPNIVMILVDDLGYGDLSCYGAPDLKTPNIDALMSAGMRFDAFYANSPVCSPTRAALLTGRFSDMVGVPGVIRTDRANSWGRLADVPLLPAMLKKAGYHSACIGKWHLGLGKPDLPQDRGFDHFKGFLGDMMDDYVTHRRHGNNYMRDGEKEIDPEGHATDLFTGWACEYIAARGKAKEPFFLYLAYNAPHTPLQPAKEWLEKARARGLDGKRAQLAALIEHLDAGIGKVLDQLKQTGVADETLVVFASDNGGQADAAARNAPWTGSKCQMFEGGIRVPMCAVWPRAIKPGSRSDRVALMMDLFPSFCEAADVKVEHEIDGVSILPDWKGRELKEDARTLVWVRREGGACKGQAHYAIRQGTWKLLQNTPFEELRLYNLKEDPREQNPLPKAHAMYAQMEKELKAHLVRASKVSWQPR